LSSLHFGYWPVAHLQVLAAAVLLVVMLMMLPWSMVLLLRAKGFIALHFVTPVPTVLSSE
jgi:hypothetical protein